MSSIESLHSNKTSDTYFHNTNDELIKVFPKNPGRVLDIGCAEGVLGAEVIKNLEYVEYTGIEVVPSVAEKAKQNLHKVLFGQAEDILPTLEDKYFDWVVLADSLEHTVDPWWVVQQVNRILNQNGKILISIPNVRNLSVTYDLIFNGNWTYTPFGIMDLGHLRFFTKSSIFKLLRDSGFLIKSCKSNPKNRWKKMKGKIISRLVSLLIFDPSAYEEFITVQWIIVAEKK